MQTQDLKKQDLKEVDNDINVDLDSEISRIQKHAS